MRPAVKVPKIAGASRHLRLETEPTIVPAYDKNEFAVRLETLALKKSVNMHIFKTELDKRRNEKKGHEESSSKKGRQRTIDTSIPKLRVKYKGMKDYSPVSCLKKKKLVFYLSPQI